MNTILRRTLLASLLLLAPIIVACTSDGHVSFFGYTSKSNFDQNIRTVRVPIFGNETYRRRLEFDLHKAVVREIESRTGWKVVPAGYDADTELVGKIVSRNKTLINYTQVGEVREAETTITVELVWRDLRKMQPGDVPLPIDGDSVLPPVLEPPQPAPKVIVQSMGDFRPELGESLATAEQEMIRALAKRIVNMMEAPW